MAMSTVSTAMSITFNRFGIPQNNLHAFANRYQTGSDIFNSIYRNPAFVTMTDTAVHPPGQIGTGILSDGHQTVCPEGGRQGFAVEDFKGLTIYNNFYRSPVFASLTGDGMNRYPQASVFVILFRHLD
jgi:hypothetical protein